MSAMVRKRPFKASVRMVAKCQQPTYAAQQRNRYSITSSARSKNNSGIVRPSASALAVVKLMTRWNFVGCSTEMSPGFVPRKSYRRNRRHAGTGPGSSSHRTSGHPFRRVLENRTSSAVSPALR